MKSVWRIFRRDEIFFWTDEFFKKYLKNFCGGQKVFVEARKFLGSEKFLKMKKYLEDETRRRSRLISAPKALNMSFLWVFQLSRLSAFGAMRRQLCCRISLRSPFSKGLTRKQCFRVSPPSIVSIGIQSPIKIRIHLQDSCKVVDDLPRPTRILSELSDDLGERSEPCWEVLEVSVS
jgi:hypothetical protein